MIAPRIGPEAAPQPSGGPAWSSWWRPIPTSSAAGRTSTSRGRTAVIRSMAVRLAGASRGSAVTLATAAAEPGRRRTPLDRDGGHALGGQRLVERRGPDGDDGLGCHQQVGDGAGAGAHGRFDLVPTGTAPAPVANAAASSAARALLRWTIAPASTSAACLTVEPLRVAIGADQHGHDGGAGRPRPPSGRERAPQPGRDGRRGRARRRASRPRHRRPRRPPRPPAGHDRRVDHRVRPAGRQLVVAEVEHGVGAAGTIGGCRSAATGRGARSSAPDRGVAPARRAPPQRWCHR